MTADTRARIQAVLDAARAWANWRGRYLYAIDVPERIQAQHEAALALDALAKAIDALPSPDECAALLADAAVGRAVREVPKDESIGVHVSGDGWIEARVWRADGNGWSDWHCWSDNMADAIAAARACRDERCENCLAVDAASGHAAIAAAKHALRALGLGG